MLYRKRAWDIMHDDFPKVDEEVSIKDVILKIQESRKVYPGNNSAVVLSKAGKLSGIITTWDIVKKMGPELLKNASKVKDTENYEKAFKLSCELGAQADIRKVYQKEAARIRPNDTLARVLEAFLDYRQDIAVVEEGDKVMGAIMLDDVYREIAVKV
ncbi:CBS domain-containing protein [Desulfonatronovibrio magnus]|uniref:CBS domain-containing protein n=1 Tax=Desulfonatronovibrio magnus TaxID=698827 RepID=UPI0005EBD91C|nr:CBS domain-containing protein [Desulfonatronovibrio magnus]